VSERGDLGRPHPGAAPAPPASTGTSPAGRPGLVSDFKSRALAGFVLALIVVGLVWAGLQPFALLVLGVGLVMSWEWSHVVRHAGADLAFGVHALSTATAAVLAAMGFAALGLAAVLAGAIIIFSLQFGDRPLMSAAGAVYTGVPAISLLWLRSDMAWGFWAVLFVFAIVVASDIAAFLCGRTFGGMKLAPSISPNKTWSGTIGGIAAAAIMAAAFAPLTGSNWMMLAVTGIVLGAIAQAGDLAESALKRSSGVKDASNLIPGHGGFMDRADGIVAAAAAAALYALFVNPAAPGQAIMLHL